MHNIRHFLRDMQADVYLCHIIPENMKIHFAPLQGYTEAPYRNAHATCIGGVDTYHTPFVRIERGEFRNKDVREISPESNTVPHLVPQLIAPDVEKARTIITLFIEKGYQEAEINLGCPFPMLAKRHNGSGMLPFPEEVKHLLSLVNEYPHIDFSVKMRLGWENPEECLVLAPLLNEAPLKQVTMLPRLGKQEYKGTTDMEGFTKFYELCSHPLVYNGDLCTIEDIHRIADSFPRLAGVMIGRGLLANPALALEYKEGRTLSADEMGEKIRLLHRTVFNSYEQQLEGGDIQLLNKMKAFWEYLLPQVDRKAKKAIHKANRLETYRQAVFQIL